MKFNRLLLIVALTAIGFSCSKENDPEPNVEEAKLSFTANAKVVEAPAALLTNDDPYAQMAAGWIEMANGLSGQLAMFTPPTGAVKSTTAITPENGRTAATSVVVWTWSDPTYGSVAYQISDNGDKYTFELFYKSTTDTGWYRYLYAEEKKDKSAGYVSVSDVWSGDRNQEIMRWSWTRSGDDFTFVVSDGSDNVNITLQVNTKTRAGSVVFKEGTVKIYEMNWDGQGKGTWKWFEEDGTLIEEGSWE